MTFHRKLIVTLLALTFGAALAGCGDTWRGAKQDTGENMEATGDALQSGGQKVKPQP
jgi:predicted small secreted protein